MKLQRDAHRLCMNITTLHVKATFLYNVFFFFFGFFCLAWGFKMLGSFYFYSLFMFSTGKTRRRRGIVLTLIKYGI